MQLVSILLALLNSLAAMLVLGPGLSGGNGFSLWGVLKVISSLLVITSSLQVWLASLRPVSTGSMLLSGLALVGLGAAITVWSLHLALVTGSIESCMLAYGGSLIVQGTASQLGFIAELRQTTHSNNSIEIFTGFVRYNGLVSTEAVS
jgi:hypothetical protein